MKALLFGALAGAFLLAGNGSSFAGGSNHHYFYFHGAKCSFNGGGITCKKNGTKDLPDIFSVGPIYSTGPTSTAYGPCGNGYWSNPMPGICNIALSEDMNHGRDATVTDGGTAPTCTVTKIWFHYGVHKYSHTKDGACKAKHYEHPSMPE